MAFIEISNTGELDRLFVQSNDAPTILFKHSLTCPISHAAYEEMALLDRETVNLIIVQDARPISNEVERRTNVMHESPQAIILQNGASVWHSSHYDITKTAVTRALEAIKN